MQSPIGDAPDGHGAALAQFTVEVRSDSEEFRVILTGELDITSAPTLDRVLEGVVSDGHPQVVVDLEGLTFMDSVGLASMVRARNGAHASDHQLTVRGASLQVRRLFAVTGMGEMFGDDKPREVAEN